MVGGYLNVQGSKDIKAGAVAVNGGIVVAGADFNTTLFTNAGLVKVGQISDTAPYGRLLVTGDYTQLAGGTLSEHIGGTRAGEAVRQGSAAHWGTAA